MGLLDFLSSAGKNTRLSTVTTQILSIRQRKDEATRRLVAMGSFHTYIPCLMLLFPQDHRVPWNQKANTPRTAIRPGDKVHDSDAGTSRNRISSSKASQLVCTFHSSTTQEPLRWKAFPAAKARCRLHKKDDAALKVMPPFIFRHSCTPMRCQSEHPSGRHDRERIIMKFALRSGGRHDEGPFAQGRQVSLIRIQQEGVKHWRFRLLMNAHVPPGSVYPSITSKKKKTPKYPPL